MTREQFNKIALWNNPAYVRFTDDGELEATFTDGSCIYVHIDDGELECETLEERMEKAKADKKD